MIFAANESNGNVGDAPPDYVELRLEVVRRSNGQYRSRIFRPASADDVPISAAADPANAWSPFRVPVQAWEVEAVISRLVVKQSRNVGSDTPDPARDLGSRLFDAALGHDGMRTYAKAAGAAATDRGLCITVETADPVIDDLPWELAYDRNVLKHFVALAPKTAIIRLGTCRATGMRPARDVRVMVVSTDEKTRSEADLVASQLRTGSLPNDALSTVHVTDWESLRNAVLTGRPTLLHLVGSGHLARRGGQRFGVRRDPGGDGITSSELGQLLSQVNGLDMLTLHGEATDRLAVAVARYVPVTVGFRELVNPDSVMTFLGELYTALWRGQSVPAAVTAARAQVVVQSQGGSDWAAAVVAASTLGPLVVPGTETLLRAQEKRLAEERLPGSALRSGMDPATAGLLARRLQIDQENETELLDQWSTVDRQLWPEVVAEQFDTVQQHITTIKAALGTEVGAS